MIRQEPPHLQERAASVFTESEEAQLLLAARSPRDRMLIRFLTGTGLRLGEACAVTLDDLVQTDQGWAVHVRGAEDERGRHRTKGRRERFTPLGLPGQGLDRDLAHYIAQERPTQVRDRHLWLTERVYDREPEPLAPEGMYRALYRLGKETGIHVHPHKFRHTWATRMLASGVSVEAVRLAGGWKDYESMQRYLHFRLSDVMESWHAAGLGMHSRTSGPIR